MSDAHTNETSLILRRTMASWLFICVDFEKRMAVIARTRFIEFHVTQVPADPELPDAAQPWKRTPDLQQQTLR